MLKNYISYIFIILIVITLLFICKFDNKSSFSEENNFHIEEPDLITKIFIADRDGNTLTLNKDNQTWIINDKFFVRDDAIKTLLSTANKVRIKRPVSNAEFDNVIKFMATTGVYVEFFIDDKIVKSYTIGSNTSDHLGTFMLLKGADKPFIIHLPFFNGFLSPRYGIQGNQINIKNWRSNIVFNKSFDDINYIKYTDFLNQKNSYILEKNTFKLINSKNLVVPINQNNILRLLNSFEDLNCEAFKEDKDKINSLVNLEELVVNKDTLRTYRIREKDLETKEKNFTVDRKYATLNNGELMLIQDFVFNKVLISINELREKN